MVISDVSASHAESAKHEDGVVCTEHGHEHSGNLQREVIEHRFLSPEPAKKSKTLVSPVSRFRSRSPPNSDKRYLGPSLTFCENSSQIRAAV